MRYLKMLGLAAVAAMALTAFLGAGSASATVLCKTTLTSGCAAVNWDYGSGTTIHAVNEGNTVLNATWTDVSCEVSTIHGTTSNTGSATTTVKGHIQALTFEKCSCAGGAVGSAHTTIINKGELEVHYISGTHNGTLTSLNTTVTVSCTPLGTQCIFGTKAEGNDLGTVTSGTSEVDATVDANGTVNWFEGTNDEGPFLCGSTAKWEGKYTITEPTPLTISES